MIVMNVGYPIGLLDFLEERNIIFLMYIYGSKKEKESKKQLRFVFHHLDMNRIIQVSHLILRKKLKR